MTTIYSFEDDGFQRLYIGLFITIGVIVSYLPQIMKMILLRSSQGLSAWFLFLGCVGCISTMFNVLILQSESVLCCFSKWSFLICLENTMGLFQVSCQLICFLTILLLFYIYFPREQKYLIESSSPYSHSPHHDESAHLLPSPLSSPNDLHQEHLQEEEESHEHDDEEDDELTYYRTTNSTRYHAQLTTEWKNAKTMAYFLIVYVAFVIMATLWVLVLEKRIPVFSFENDREGDTYNSLILSPFLELYRSFFSSSSSLSPTPNNFHLLDNQSVIQPLQVSIHAQQFASVLGLVATCSAIVQFLPQIFFTWKQKKVGALSIPTMFIQCPGSFVFAYSLYIQPTTNWSSWVSYLCSGTCQGVLLLLCLIFYMTHSDDIGEAGHGNDLDNGIHEDSLGHEDEEIGQNKQN